jgi:hypothetical protein
MAVIINASTSTGLVQSADTSGIIQFQSNGSTKATLNSSGFSYPGAVLQVVQTAPIANLITTSTSYVNFSDLNTSITPTSASSKILIIAGALNIYNGAANANMQITLYRGATNLGGANGYFFYAYGNSSINLSFPQTITYLDSPATTSSITYGVYGKTSSGSMSFNNGNSQLSMVLMEIAA